MSILVLLKKKGLECEFSVIIFNKKEVISSKISKYCQNHACFTLKNHLGITFSTYDIDPATQWSDSLEVTRILGVSESLH